jgi:glycoside hydrolase-like protein
MKGLDFAGGRPGARAIKDAGFDFVVRYLTDGGTELPGKLLLPTEMDDYIANDVKVCFMWETTADRALAGTVGGANDANNADHYLLSLGLASQVIYFAIDFDAAEGQQIPINDYLRGAAGYLGGWRVGGYGGFWPLTRAFDAGVIHWGEQTVAWSGNNLDNRRHITQTGEQVTINGVVCDVLEANALDFGQYPPPLGERINVDFTTPWIDHYHDNLPDKGATLPVGDLISWAATHAAHSKEAVDKLRTDLPGIITDAIAKAVVEITINGVPVAAENKA